jgi:signal transduction histidine kinase
MRRLERLHTQKEDLKLILKNLPDALNSAYSTVEQTLYENNPNGKRIRISINLVQNQIRTDINIIAEDLLEEIFINLFSNSVKYTDSAEVKIDVLLKDYFIGEAKYWMIMISDHGKGIPDPMKKEHGVNERTTLSTVAMLISRRPTSPDFASSFYRTLRQTYFFSLPSSLLHPFQLNISD